MTIRQEYQKLKKEMDEAEITIRHNKQLIADLQEKCPHEGKPVLRSIGLANIYSCPDCGMFFTGKMRKVMTAPSTP